MEVRMRDKTKNLRFHLAKLNKIDKYAIINMFVSLNNWEGIDLLGHKYDKRPKAIFLYESPDPGDHQ